MINLSPNGRQPRPDPLGTAMLDGLERLSVAPAGRALAGTLASAVFIGAVDYLTGYEAAFSVFYIVPVSLVAWRFGQVSGLLAGVICALAWQVVNILAGEVLSSPIIELWNTFTRIVTYALVTILLCTVRDNLETEARRARYDELTGAMKAAPFRDRLKLELSLAAAKAEVLTVAYLDLDGFKALNDRAGHAVGDMALRSFAHGVASALSRDDYFGRLGGDEFALVLRPRAGERDALEAVRRAARDGLALTASDVTVSIGAVRVDPGVACGAAEVLKQADALMYEAKRAGRDAVRFDNFAQTHAPPLRAA